MQPYRTTNRTEKERVYIMGYESKVFILERNEYEFNNNKLVYGSEIANFDLSKMGYSQFNGKLFREIFETEIDFDLYLGNESTKEDCYGHICKYADIETVLNWLYQFIEQEQYRRVYPLISCLECLRKDKKLWSQLVVVHYGY